MENVVKVIKELRETKSSKVKLDILNQYKDDMVLKRVMELTYDPFLKYGISKKVFTEIESSKDRITSFIDIECIALYLSENNINNELRDTVNHIIANLENDDYRDIARGILCKNLQVGISKTTINKVWPNLIKEFSAQAGIKLTDAKFEPNEEIWITEKFDGIRCLCIYNSGNIRLFSRSGKEILGLNDLKRDIERFLLINNCMLRNSIVLDGELLKINPNNLSSGDLYRETVSIVNSKSENKEDIDFHVFDIISYEDFVNGKSEDNYKTRRDLLDSLIWHGYVKIAPVLYHGSNHNKIQELSDYMKENNKEGLMINKNDYYITKRSKSLVKCKVFLTADVRVIDVLEGQGENEGKLGKITIEFEHDGKLYRCNVGSGFDNNERIKYWNDKSLLIGKIVEVKYFEISKDKSGDYALRLVTWTHRIRHDKTEISMN